MPLLQRAAKLDDDKKGGGSMSLIAMVETPPNPKDHPKLATNAQAQASSVNSDGDNDSTNRSDSEQQIQQQQQQQQNKKLTRKELQDLDLSPLDLQRMNALLDRGVELDTTTLQQLGIRSQKLDGQKAMAKAATEAHPFYAAFQVRPAKPFVQ